MAWKVLSNFVNYFTGWLAFHLPACRCTFVSDGGKGHHLDILMAGHPSSVVSALNSHYFLTHADAGM